jgi:SRSO17 transposase
MRDSVRAHVLDHLASPSGTLVVDETGFLKKGRQSAGVQRQYSGTAGRVENCQIGVFLAYASEYGQALIDRELYLPESWVADPERCRQAGVPAERPFLTKPQLAEQMLARAYAAGVTAPWVTGDCVYGDNRAFRQFLERQGQGYVLAVSAKETVGRWGQPVTVASVLARTDLEWRPLSAGAGSQGPRLYDWTSLSIDGPDGADCRLLLRRSRRDPRAITAYLSFAPQKTSLAELVRVAGSRWSIETCFQETKDDLGLDQYEVRSWIGWYRHITLVMVAQAFLARLRVGTQKNAPGARLGSGPDGSRTASPAESAGDRLPAHSRSAPAGALVALAALSPSHRPLVSPPPARP